MVKSEDACCHFLFRERTAADRHLSEVWLPFRDLKRWKRGRADGGVGGGEEREGSHLAED